MATSVGTQRYQEQLPSEFEARYFQRLNDWRVSSIGAGTYLGAPTDEVDDRYHEALVTALESGINVVDTASNYRCQRSERVVGRAMADASIDRDAVVVATKGGYLSFDGDHPEDTRAYIRSEFIEPGLVKPHDLAGGIHCIAPDFIEHQLEQSLRNLDLGTIDHYYVHTPEMQLTERPPGKVYDLLEATFARLEARAAAGDIHRYGLAVWDAFRVGRDDDAYLSLSEVLARAEAAANAAGTAEPHFGALQVPFNPLMADAFTVLAHDGDDEPTSVLRFARRHDLPVFASATLAHGRLAAGLPDDVAVWFNGDTPVQRAINFARSAPAIICALVGMRSSAHVEENVAAGTFDRMGTDAFEVVFEGEVTGGTPKGTTGDNG